MNEMKDPIFPEEPLIPQPDGEEDIPAFIIPESPAASKEAEDLCNEEAWFLQPLAVETPAPVTEVKETMAKTVPAEKPKRKRRRSKRDIRVIISRILLRIVLVLLITVSMVIGAAYVLLDSIFNGPSQAACELLTMSLAKSSGTWWIPAFFMGEERAAQIMAGDKTLEAPPDISGEIFIDTEGAINSNSDEWAKYPDGIRIEYYQGDTYNAHIMIVRDPSTVQLVTSYPYSGGTQFSTSLAGQRITSMMEFIPNAIAGINAGAFYDNGTSDLIVGSVPQGLVVSGGEVVWKSGKAPFEGFVGFDSNNKLIVASSMTAAKIEELKIRDGCEFGPVLIVDGVVNEEAYNNESGFNPRTAIGQRADGAVVMVCIDGRQMGSIGGSFADMIDIMVEYGAVNACNLDGGSSSVMMYRDNYGRYGTPGEVVMINSYSLMQEAPRRMPTFFLVIPSSED